jgi:hypothetical protein
VKLFGADLVILQKKDATKLVLILLVFVPLVLFVWHARNETARAEDENIALLRSLKTDAVAGVSISDERGRPLKTVTDRAALASFATAASSVEPYEPNHPYVVQRFQFAVRLPSEMDRFDAYTLYPADQTMYIDFHPGGNAKSKQLFDWMKTQGLFQ